MRPSLFPVPQVICPQRIYKFRLQFFICGHVSNPVMSTILPCDPVKRDVSARTQRLHSSLVNNEALRLLHYTEVTYNLFLSFFPPKHSYVSLACHCTHWNREQTILSLLKHAVPKSAISVMPVCFDWAKMKKNV